MRLVENTFLEDEYRAALNEMNSHELLEEWLTSPRAPKRYKAILDAYHSYDDNLSADRRIVGLMREKTLVNLEKRGVSRAQLVRDLNLNKGNVYAYLAGDNTKVSKATAQRIMEYSTEA